MKFSLLNKIVELVIQFKTTMENRIWSIFGRNTPQYECDNFQPLEDFDAERFMGTWYEMKATKSDFGFNFHYMDCVYL